MSQVSSPSAYLVNGANTLLAGSEKENIVKTGARVITRAAVDTALIIPAAIETVVSAILTALTSPLYLTSFTKPVFDWAKNHTIVAAKATGNALTGIVGKTAVAKKEAPAASAKQSLYEKAMEKVSNIASSVLNFVKNRKRKEVIGAIGLVALTAGIYYTGAVGKACELATSGAGQLTSALSKGSEWATWAATGAASNVSGAAVWTASTAVSVWNSATSLLGPGNTPTPTPTPTPAPAPAPTTTIS